MDRSGSRWVATRFGGLFQFTPRAVRTYTTQDGLCHSTVLSVAASRDGGVWVGTVRGVQRFRNGRFEFPNLSLAPEAHPPFPEADSRRICCRAIYEDNAGDLWGAGPSDQSDLLWFTRQPDRFRRQPVLLAGDPYALCEDTQGRMWIGSSGGITCVSTNAISFDWPLSHDVGGSFVDISRKRGDWWHARPGGLTVERGLEKLEVDRERWLLGNPNPDGAQGIARTSPLWSLVAAAPFPAGARFTHYDVRAILEEASGIWFGTWGGGVNRIVPGRIDIFSRTNGLAGDFVKWLHADGDGAVWVGTTDGLSRICNGGIGRSVTTQHGLPDNTIHQILEDDLGYFWIGGKRGLFRVAFEELTAVAEGRKRMMTGVLFDEADGMVSSEPGHGSHHTACKSHDGELWFATDQGLVAVNPRAVRAPNAPPRTFIEVLRTSAQGLDLSAQWVRFGGPAPGETADTSRLILPPGSGRQVELHYTALDFDAPEKLRFKYRLEGHDKEWIDAADRRIAYFTNLRAGKYRFQVCAGRAHGSWDEIGATIVFVIAPFYYQSFWFMALCGAALLGATALGHRAAVATIRRRQRVETTRAFHDRLAGKLSAIAKAAQSGASPDRELLDGIAQLAQTALRNLRLAIANADPDVDKLDTLLTHLIQTAEESLVPLKISLRLDIPLEIPTLSVHALVREHIILFASEVLNNIVKHAEASTVHLRVRIQSGQLHLAIEDNGRGFHPSRLGTNDGGLANLRMHATAIGGFLEIRSAPGQGTCVQVTVQLA